MPGCKNTCAGRVLRALSTSVAGTILYPRRSQGLRVATIELERGPSMNFLTDAGFAYLDRSMQGSSGLHGAVLQ